ncbi:MAG: nuclear transport factor 2 family protein, partial [Spirochaetales bacterium]|nr:nuclear transport factor 2 family protein [Spirochaetales bacterium]
MSPIRMSKPEAAIRVVLRFNDLFNLHDVEEMSRLLSDDCVVEDTGPAPDGTVYTGKAAAADLFRELFMRSPGVRNEIEEIFGFGS